MSDVKFCLSVSTPDMLDLSFVVKVLSGTPDELGQRAIEWGYDGIEFMPDRSMFHTLRYLPAPSDVPEQDYLS